MTVHQLENSMSYSEFLNWMAYYSEFPTMESINESQMAVLTMIVANIMGGKTKVEDFLLSGKDRRKTKSSDQHSVFDAFNAVANDMT